MRSQRAESAHDDEVVAARRARKLETAKATAAARAQSLFEDALVGVYISRPDGTLATCNPAFARMLGFVSVAEALDTNLQVVYPDPLEHEIFVNEVRAYGRLDQCRVRLRRRDGRAVDVLETVIGEFDEEGDLLEMSGVLVDISASVREEEALAERERQFRAVFVDAADAMLILDDNRGVVEANRAAGALFGAHPNDLIGQALDSLVVEGAEQLGPAWRELLALGETKREHSIGEDVGVRHLVECSYRANVQVGRHLCIARDITDRRLLEERVTQAERIESVGRLAGGIAHDFNNLLTAILGYTELLIGARQPDDPAYDDLQEIQRAGQRAAALTQQLLAFSRKQVLIPKEVDLNLTVTGLQSMLGRLIREDITLTCEVADQPACVRIDPNQIEQVILNLVLNARDALPGGGTIRLEVERVSASEAEVPPDLKQARPEYVRLRVTDNGTGMAPDVRAHLFEPFFTTKEQGKGTGLGLASVYGIVHQSNGYIGVETGPGLGTTFTMYFPASPGAALHEPSADAQALALDGRETILLVEDEDSVRVIISAVLRRHGYQVLEASSPKGATEIFAHHAGDVDLLLTDVVMPEMSGPALAQRLVSVHPGLRVLFISGYADGAGPKIDSENPNVAFLRKPFRASVLTSKVREVLGRARRAA